MTQGGTISMSTFQGTKTPGVRFKMTSKGRTFYIDYKDGDGKRQQHAVAGDYEAAKAARAAIVVKRSVGEHVPGRVETTYTVYSGECIDKRLASGKIKPQTAKLYHSANNLYVVPVFGRRKLREVTKHDVLRVVETMQEKGLGSGTISNAIKVMSITYSQAQWEYGIPNHVRALRTEDRPKAKKKQKMRVLEQAEIEAIIAAARTLRRSTVSRYVALFMLAIYSGLRQSELLGLWWEDLTLSGDVPSIHVHAQLGRANGARVLYLKSKEEGDSRTVEIPRGIAKLLLEYKEQQFSLGFAGPEDFVFSAGKGRSLGQVSAWRTFQKCRDKAGVHRGLPKEERAGFHDMRHTFASMLIAGGADIIEVANALGHAKPSITLDTYSHLWGADARRGKLRDILEAVI
jgi:integrase